MPITARISCFLALALVFASCADQGASALNAAKAYNAQHANDKMSQKDVDATIANIQSNPNMAPQAKAMAIAQLESHAGMGVRKH